MPEMKTLCGYEVVDAKARQDIEELKNRNVDLAGYATETYVDNAIAAIPEVDLSKHALKSEIPDVSDFITSIPSEYVTDSELNAKGYLTEHQDISGKADKNHKHTEYLTEHQDISHLALKTSIPTKVSQLANDSNYLTSIPTEYITETELTNKDYVTSSAVASAYTTKAYVDNAVANAGSTNVTITGGSVPLDLVWEAGSKITDADTLALLNSLDGRSPLPPCTIIGNPVLSYHYTDQVYEFTTMNFYPSDARLRFVIYSVEKVDNGYAPGWYYLERVIKEGAVDTTRIQNIEADIAAIKAKLDM